MENGLDHCQYEDFPRDFLMAPAILRPLSHGRVTLASNDPLMPPIIDPNYLSDDRDVVTLLGGIRAHLRLAHTRTFQNAGIYLNQTQVAGCRGHRFDSDQYWECVMRTWAVTCHHPSGTCRMGIDEQAVVDPQLRVFGVRGLRVVDASVMPNVISGNTNAPTIMIAEKAADLIKNTWR
ncbi:hypothetical protein B566_EDAN011613 [Ephemera danica]|nr:hypothetical protein B566_EDAN011613 [Ephemera danica]